MKSSFITLDAEKPGTNELLLDVAGLPVKKVDVQVLEDFKVVPGGQSIGVKLHTLGVLVVGHHLVINNEGKEITRRNCENSNWGYYNKNQWSNH